jgi:integrase
MKLDSKTIAGLKLPDGKNDIIYWDQDLSGYGYRLRRSGDKVRGTFIAQYRHHRNSRRFLIGTADKLSASQARDQAKKVLAQVELGHDPQQQREDQRRKEVPHSLSATVHDYLAAKKGKLRPRSYIEVERYLTGRYFKTLHHTDIGNIARRDVAGCLNKIVAPVSADRARAALSAFFTWCMEQGLADINPVVGTGTPDQPESRDRVLKDTEIKAIWQACEQCEHTKYGAIVRLLILTGCRRIEIGGMRWSEIDFQEGTWTLPKARSKNKHAHTLPLTPLMMEIIKAVPRQVGRDCLFGARTEYGFSVWEQARSLFDKRLSGDMEPWRLHDIRRSVATGMADIGIAPHIIETVLNHRSGHKGGIAGIYNRSSYQRDVAAAIVRWSDHIRDLMEGRAKVVPLRTDLMVST